MPQTTNIEYNKGQAPFDPAMRVELAVNDRAEAIVFHNKPFVQELSWLEFDLDEGKLTFVMESGDLRDFNIPVRPELSRYMQNAFQVLMVLMDERTGEPVEGGYIPLIIHRA
jgi:hypothetical protein